MYAGIHPSLFPRLKRKIDLSYPTKPVGMDLQIALAEKDQVIMELQETVQVSQLHNVSKYSFKFCNLSTR